MDAGRPPARTIGVGDVVNETFSIYGQNFGALIGSAIVVFVVVGLISGLLQTGGAILILLGGIVQLAGYALYVGFVVELVSDVRDGRRDQTVGDLFSAVTPVVVPLIVFGILSALAIGIAAIFLLVPGLILLTFWSVGAPAIVVEKVGALEAFGRSWGLVRGQAWSVFGALVVIFLIVIAIGVVLLLIASPIGSGATIVASIVSNTITAPIYALAVSVIFFDLGGGGAGTAIPAAQAAPPPPAPSEPPPAPPPAEPPPAPPPAAG